MAEIFKQLLFKDDDRYTIYPIMDKDVWKMYKTHESAFWMAEDIDMSKDKSDLQKLSPQEYHLIKNILIFFAGADGIINENLALKFTKEVKLKEVLTFYHFQIMMENIHNEVYCNLIETYIEDSNEKQLIFHQLSNVECVQNKHKWALKWINNTTPFTTRLLAFSIVEGIYFSGSFCVIYWFGEKNILKGLVQANKYIARDEGIHTNFAILLYNKINDRLPQEQVYEIIKEAVDIEKQFIQFLLPQKLIGMNYDLMCNYIEFVADNLLQDLRYNKLFGSKNPFNFMNKLNSESITNFFEGKETNYQMANNSQIKSSKINTDIDF